MTIKEAVGILMRAVPSTPEQAVRAQGRLFEARVMLTGLGCPVCAGSGEAEPATRDLPAVICWACFGSGRELAQVWPPALAACYFGVAIAREAPGTFVAPQDSWWRRRVRGIFNRHASRRVSGPEASRAEVERDLFRVAKR